MNNTTITAHITVRRHVRTVEMVANEDTTPAYAAYLISKGYTGQTFIGTAPAEGRKAPVLGLYIRTMGGQFVPAI